MEWNVYDDGHVAADPKGAFFNVNEVNGKFLLYTVMELTGEPPVYEAYSSMAKAQAAAEYHYEAALDCIFVD